MSQEIRIIVEATRIFWRCIPKKFTSCPTGPEFFQTNSDLEELRRIEYEEIGTCPNKVNVRNKWGFDADINPIIIKRKS